MDTKTDYLSLSEYAIHRGVSKQLISKWKKAGRLVLVKGRVHTRATDALLEKTIDIRGGNRSINAIPENYATKSEYLEAKIRDMHWSAEQKRIKALKLATGLVEAKSVHREALNQARLLHDAFLNLPDRLAASIAAETDAIAVHNLLLKEIRTICNQLAGSFHDVADNP